MFEVKVPALVLLARLDNELAAVLELVELIGGPDELALLGRLDRSVVLVEQLRAVL